MNDKFLVREIVWHLVHNNSFENIEENYPFSLIRRALVQFERLQDFYNDYFPCDELLEQDIIIYDLLSD